ncbi:S8/S53 family peptidase [Streptosporangium sp. CA-115845]|uniref:S8/S53 family peptidase n=1 Tax=Streptosporangium sp. CA-115845 TaxID=3240071 RepID=UPI003D93ACD6
MAPDRFQEQFDQIQAAMGEEVVLAAGPDDSPRFLYEKGCVLARRDEAPEVAQAIRRAFRRDRGSDRGVELQEEDSPGGVSRIRVGPLNRAERWRDRDVSDALRAVDELERANGRRMVSRNHIVSIAVNCCPGDEPVPVARCGPPNPAVAKRVAGATAGPVSVLVIDTGLVENYRSHPWMSLVEGEGKEIELDSEGILKQYVGHGTFIAGLISAVAPSAAITVNGALVNAGAISEKCLGDLLLREMRPLNRWPDIINLSAGTLSTDHRTLMGLEDFMRELVTDHPETLLVAAAGNNGSDERFHPAAYADDPDYAGAVVSVGALRKDGQDRACFSGHGPWVTAYAPGERLVSAFTAVDDTPVPYDYQHSTYDHCRYGSAYDCTCQFPPHRGELSEKMAASPNAIRERVEFDGLAQWSGTSFSAPLVVGMIVNHMVRNNVTDARQAAAELLSTPLSGRGVQGLTAPTLIPATWTPSSVQSVPVVP